MHQRLVDIQDKLSQPAKVLDAACHALITRDMFPDTFLYHGLDVASSRLNKALKYKKSEDRLILADLTNPLPVENYFDVVVSCNTFSHIPFDNQPQALTNLFKCLKPKHDLLINVSIDASLPTITSFLLRNFQSVEPIYFDSFLSAKNEDSGVIDVSNVMKYVEICEMSLPNDACMHSQVFFHAKSKIADSSNLRKVPLPSFIPSKIFQLTSVPSVSLQQYATDSDFIKSLNNEGSNATFLMTTKLLSSPMSCELVNYFVDHSLNYLPLAPSLEIPSNCTKVFILGLEKEWSHDEALDRLSLNQVRKTTSLDIFLVSISYRGGSKCVPSTVLSDF